MPAVDSRRFYVSLTDAQAAPGCSALTSDQLTVAEELIDQYVGPQQKFVQFELTGRATSGSTTGLVLQANKDQNAYQKDFFKNMEVEIIGGAGIGQMCHISGSVLPGTLTFYETLATALDSTSVYRIYQLAKFPRIQDVYLDGYNNPFQYYKAIPINVRDAVIEQCKFILKMGTNFFITDSYSMDAEVLDNYRYQRRNLAGDTQLLIAPAAKLLLKGIMNRKGQIIDAGI